MPASRKPRPATDARPRAATGRVLPDRDAMQAWLVSLQSENAGAALSAAQELIYDAWDQSTSRSRLALARKALALSPLCADAYNLLADEAKTPAEARDLYQHGIDAAELALGPAAFKELGGRFWGHLETRPYMRARHGLALSLLRLGDDDAAFGHFRAMLTLNPNDNQGIRYLLLAGLLSRDDDAAVETLLASYAGEWSTQWLYTGILMAFRRGRANRPATRKLLADAFDSNEHVPAILAETKRPVFSRDGYVAVGSPAEATEYAQEFGEAWRKTPGAITWLFIAAEAATRSRRSAKQPARD